MVAIIPTPSFRGNLIAHAAVPLAVTASISLSRTTAKLIDNNSGNSVGILAYLDSFTADSLVSGAWLRDSGGDALPASIVDFEVRWTIERYDAVEEEWVTYDHGKSITRPVTLELPDGTQLTSCDPSTDQRGFGCQLAAYHTGQYRFVATASIRFAGGDLQIVTVTSATVTVSAHSNVIHVDPDAGDDANPGTLESPKQTAAAFPGVGSRTDVAVVLKRGAASPLTLSSNIGIKGAADMAIGAYGTGSLPEITCDGAFNVANGLLNDNIDALSESIDGLDISCIRFNCNRRAEAGLTTAASSSDTTIANISVHDCEFVNTASARYGLLFSWGNSDLKRHTGISIWGCDFQDPTATYKWRQSIYLQGVDGCGIGNCKFAGEHDDPTLDHSVYANTPSRFFAYWLDGAPNGAVGSAIRGGLCNISISGTAGWVPDTNGVRFICVYECDGTDSTNAVDISQAQFDPFDTTIAAKPTQVKYFDLVVLDAIYQKGGGNVVLAKNIKRALFANLVGDTLTKSVISYGVNESKFVASGTDYDTLPRITLGENHAYECGRGVITWDSRAAGGAVLNAEATQRIETTDDAVDREAGIADLTYLTGSTNTDAGGGIGDWIWTRPVDRPIRFNDRTLDDPTDLSKDDDIAAPTGNAVNNYLDEAGLLAYAPGFVFQVASEYDDPAAGDFAGPPEPPNPTSYDLASSWSQMPGKLPPPLSSSLAVDRFFAFNTDTLGLDSVSESTILDTAATVARNTISPKLGAGDLELAAPTSLLEGSLTLDFSESLFLAFWVKRLQDPGVSDTIVRHVDGSTRSFVLRSLTGTGRPQLVVWDDNGAPTVLNAAGLSIPAGLSAEYVAVGVYIPASGREAADGARIWVNGSEYSAAMPADSVPTSTVAATLTLGGQFGNNPSVRGFMDAVAIKQDLTPTEARGLWEIFYNNGTGRENLAASDVLNAVTAASIDAAGDTLLLTFAGNVYGNAEDIDLTVDGYTFPLGSLEITGSDTLRVALPLTVAQGATVTLSYGDSDFRSGNELTPALTSFSVTNNSTKTATASLASGLSFGKMVVNSARSRNAVIENTGTASLLLTNAAATGNLTAVTTGTVVINPGKTGVVSFSTTSASPVADLSVGSTAEVDTNDAGNATLSITIAGSISATSIVAARSVVRRTAVLDQSEITG